MNEEILDIVSANDEVIGTQKRIIVHQQKIKHFRSVNAFIINSSGKLWIPRRHPNKELWPLYLDASVSGCVCSGENYDEAFSREALEELNLDLNMANYKQIDYLTPIKNGTSSFMNVYLIFQDNVPDYNKNEFIEFYWLTLQEFFEKLKKGDKAKNDIPIILNHIKEKIISL